MSLGDAVDFELGVTVPQLSLIPGLDAMVDPAEEQWQDRALCAQTDPEAFFPEKGGSTREASASASGARCGANASSTHSPTTSASVSGAGCRNANAGASSAASSDDSLLVGSR